MLGETAALAKAATPGMLVVPEDVFDPAEIAALFDTVQALRGACDIGERCGVRTDRPRYSCSAWEATGRESGDWTSRAVGQTQPAAETLFLLCPGTTLAGHLTDG